MEINIPDKLLVAEDGGSNVVVRPGPGRPAQASAEQMTIPSEVPVLPVRNMVLMPGTVVPLQVGREKSRRLLSDVVPDQKVFMCICQKNMHVDDPGPDDLYKVGTCMALLKLLRLDDGNQSIIVHGLARARVDEWLGTDPYLTARISVLEDITSESTETEALMLNVRQIAQRVIQLSPNIPEEANMVLANIDQPGPLADFLGANLQMALPEKQELLEELNVNRRLERVNRELQHQLEVLELSNKIQDKVRDNIEKSQKEYFLQEQLKAIQKELGQMDEKGEEVAQIREKIETIGMPEEIKKQCLREVSRMERIPMVSPEYNVVRTYLDWMSELPWAKSTKDMLDVNRAREVLDRDHYDLDRVKRRILEYLAVRKLAPESRGPILCFVGPPGVGKTSLGQSIARALGREFIRMSLGGMRDEAELRGHRRTYIGAMPGRIIQEIRKAGTNNPVFMLDEVDKVGSDWRGDPTAALLEVLDPAQNKSFQDHYLNAPFDLSNVMFIATANYMNPVPPALRDRMEVIELPGYTEREKLQIATKYLIPRQLKENGLKASQAKWSDAAVTKIIDSYTREAGVRELERQIGSVCRGIAAEIAAEKAKSRTVSPALVTKILGPRKYESELALRTKTPGVATGLAYTPSGGEIIFIEAAAYPGKGSFLLTGQIGDVMKESAQAAISLVKSRASEMGVAPKTFSQSDIHVHVPAGAVPKDGPSAGVAMLTALASLLSGRAVNPTVAMTGEITLRGLVLPVGGVKEKCLAANRAGIKTVIIPKRNKKDLVDIPEEVKKQLRFVFAENVDDVLDVALTLPRRNRSKVSVKQSGKSSSSRKRKKIVRKG